MIDHLAELSPALADRYTIEGELGRGGMATVYLAEDLKHERKVAIKVMRPELAATLAAERFDREIRIAAKLVHPHILPVLESGRTGTKPGPVPGSARANRRTDEFLYYVMPFVEGESLRDRLHRERQLPIEDALAITREVASALSYAHDEGVIHRDIKPENIMLSVGGALVADFGIARAMSQAGGEQLTETGVAVGTPAYMSPEQASADRIDARRDVYSLGTVLYEMLGGDPPFTGTTPQAILARKISDSAPSLTPLRDTVTQPLEQTVMKSLARSPADRYATAELFVKALEAAQRGETTPTVVVQTARKPVKLFALVGAFIAVAALLLTIVPLLRNAPSNSLFDPDRVAVGIFRNVTGDPSLDLLGERVGHWITQGVQQAGIAAAEWEIARQASLHVSDVVREGRVRDPVYALAEETGAGTVITGAVYLVGDSLEIQVSITDAGEGRSLGHVDPVRGERAAETELILQVQQRTMSFLSVRFENWLSDWAPNLAVTPPTFDAYQTFLEGLEFIGRRQFREGIRAMQNAYEMDTTWVQPLLRISAALSIVGSASEVDSVLTILESFGESLTPYERSVVQAHRAGHEGDAERSLAAWRRAAELAPGSPDAFNRGVQAKRYNRPFEAVEAFEAFDPDRGWARGNSIYWAQYSHALLLIGEYERALENAKRALEANPEGGMFGRAFVLEWQVGPLAAMGRSQELNDVLDEMEAVQNVGRMAAAFRSSTELLRAIGHQSVLQEIGERATAWFESWPQEEKSSHAFVDVYGQVLYNVGFLNEAKEVLDAVLRESPGEWYFRVSRIVVNVARGDSAQARSDADWLANLDDEAWGIPQNRVLWFRGVVAGALSDRERALDLLRESGWRLSKNWWPSMFYAALRGYGPFEELVAPKG